MENKISVLINTLNEEKNIRNCLESVKWADEIILVDMWSDDKTIEIAKEYTDKIYMHKRLGYADPARQFALEKATNDWVLVLDADEMVTVKLKSKLLEIEKKGEYEAVEIPHKNYFFGKLMNGAGWGALQDTHIRFFKRDVMEFTGRVHGFNNLSNQANILHLNIEEYGFIHFGMDSVEQYIEKLNRYTTIEALNDFEEGIKFNLVYTILKSFKEFFSRFIIQKGFKDGLQGFVLSVLMAVYWLVSGFKLFLMYKHNSSSTKEMVNKYYKQIAEEEIDAYKNIS